MKNWTSDISKTTVNFTSQNALKKVKRCVRCKCVCLASMFV